MRDQATLKSVLNRQFIAMNSYMPMSSGMFECKRDTNLGTETPSVSFKPFERSYAIAKGLSRVLVESE